MTRQEVERVRGLATRMGVADAAEALGISRQSLLAILAGTGVKDGTELKVVEALKKGVTDTVRGERSGNVPTTKRRA